MRHPTVKLSSDPVPSKAADLAPKKAKALVKFDEPKQQRDEMQNPYWIEDNEEMSTTCAKRKDIKPIKSRVSNWIPHKKIVWKTA